MPGLGYSRAAQSEIITDPPLILLTFPHPSTSVSGWGGVLRYVLDDVAMTSRGVSFQPLAGEVTWSPGLTTAPGTIEFDVFEATLWGRFRDLPVGSQPTVAIEEVRRSAPDVVERFSPIMIIGRVSREIALGRLELTEDNDSDQALSRASFDPARFPGLY